MKNVDAKKKTQKKSMLNECCRKNFFYMPKITTTELMFGRRTKARYLSR